MQAFSEMQTAFERVHQDFQASSGIQRLLDGNLNVKHYASLLRQIFHHTRENPQLQALATVHFRGTQREMVRPFLRHALSECGHDQLALEDLKALGFETEGIPGERPLPETSALIAWGFYQVQNLDPVGYLGYLFFLEFVPTRSGQLYQEKILEMGVPEEALRFLHDHSTVDLGHNRWMERYAEQLLPDVTTLEEAIYSMRVTGRLYASMVEAAFHQVDCFHPVEKIA